MKVTAFWKEPTRSAPDTGASEGGVPPIEQEAAPDYSWMGDFAKDGTPDFDGFKAHYQELAAEQARRAENEPQVPEAYDFSLPGDFDPGVQLPEGVAVELDPENPLFQDLSAVLKENRVPQSVAAELPKLLARYEAQRYAQLHEQATKEFEALGATEAARSARVSSVARALETKLPAEQAKALMDATKSAAGVKALEAILMPKGITAPSATPKPAIDENVTGFNRVLAARQQAM